MWDDTMMKAAYVHDRIMDMGRSPDINPGGLRFAVQERGTDKQQPMRLIYLPPCPRRFWHGIPFAEKRYRAQAQVNLDHDRLTITTRAFCCPKDNPRRWLGRTIVLMRMAAAVGPLGYDVLAVWNKDVRLVIPADCQVPEGYVPMELCKKAWRRAYAAVATWAAGVPTKEE